MSHLTRRGAVYHWRRRFGGPALGCPAEIITLSLFTKEKAVARRRGAELSLMSETLSEEVRRHRLAPEEAKAILVAVARKHMAKLELHAVFDRQDSRPDPMSGERADRVVGAAYRLLAERGRAAGLGEKEGAFLSACGLDPGETFQVNVLLDFLRERSLVPPLRTKLGALLAQHAPGVEPTTITLAEAETLYYRGMAAACLKTGPRWGATLESDLALVEQEAPPGVGSAPATNARAAPVPPARAFIIAASWPKPSSSTCTIGGAHPRTASAPGSPKPCLSRPLEKSATMTSPASSPLSKRRTLPALPRTPSQKPAGCPPFSAGKELFISTLIQSQSQHPHRDAQPPGEPRYSAREPKRHIRFSRHLLGRA